MEERLVIRLEPPMSDNSGEAVRLSLYPRPLNRLGSGDEYSMMRI